MPASLAESSSIPTIPAPEGPFTLTITRTFAAPRSLVWQAFTDPAMATQWMGPRGFDTTDFAAGTQPGDPWHLTMQGNVPGTGQPVSLRQGGTIRECHPPELLSYTFAWQDRAAVGLQPSPYSENLITIRFEDHGDSTVMHFTQTPFARAGERDGHTGGWNSAFDALYDFLNAQHPPAALIPGELHLKRLFAAPRALLFEAWTNPELLAQWWGPAGFTNRISHFEPRHDGTFRIELEAPDGTLYPMTGRFLEVYPPYRLHFISTPLGPHGEVLFETWTSVYLAEVPEGTQLTLDVHLRSTTSQADPYLKGMTPGWNQSLDRLQAVTATSS